MGGFPVPSAAHLTRAEAVAVYNSREDSNFRTWRAGDYNNPSYRPRPDTGGGNT